MTNFRSIVEKLFRQLPYRKGDIRTNPITGERWVCGMDRPKTHKERAIRALMARKYFEWDVQWYAPDAGPLPLSPQEISDAKMQTGIRYLAAVYAQSVQTRDWNRSGHPNFGVYARCVMASRFAPHFIENDQTLLKRFPPYHEDLLEPGLVWPKHLRG